MRIAVYEGVTTARWSRPWQRIRKKVKLERQSSEIVGVSQDANTKMRPFLWRKGQMSDLGTFPGLHVFGEDINSWDQIVGDAFADDDTIKPFVQWGSHVRTLEPLPGANGVVYAKQINELGVIGGFSDSSAGRRAVIWINGQPIDLGVLPGTVESQFGGLNDLGQVVGDSGGRPFRWQLGVMEALPVLQSGSTTATAINNRGQIVGNVLFSKDQGLERAALLWEDSEVVYLTDLIDAADPLKQYVRLGSAVQINNKGQIVASGGDSRAPNISVTYLLTPVRR